MEFDDFLTESIRDAIDQKGLSISIRKDFNEKEFILNEEVDKDNIEVSMLFKYISGNLFLRTFAKLVDEGKIDINFNDHITEKELDYLKKLSRRG